MKISTLLSEGENYAIQLKNDLNMYLTRLKANGIYTVATDTLSNELDRLGHSVTPEALVDLLKDNKYIQNASVESIDLVGAPSSDQSPDEARMKVHNLAVSASKRGM